MSGNWYELNSLAWIAGGSTLKAQAGSVLVVVITIHSYCSLLVLSAIVQALHVPRFVSGCSVR